jgi:hypothetical protein
MLLRLLERIHGHLGWLAVAALLHPAIMLRNPKRRARLSVILSTLVVLLAASLGAGIYPDYRMRIKQRIFIEAPTFGWMFERKEHLAVAAVSFTLIGCILHIFSPVFPEGSRVHAARTAHVAFVFAFAFALVVACIGVAVASFKSF